MSTEKKLLVVMGATGQQGGAVIRGFLNHPDYRLRAITRDPTKPAALALSAQGVEVVQGSHSDASSLRAAFDSAAAIFIMVDAFPGVERGVFEPGQGKLAIDIAAEIPTLEHLVFSSVPSITEGSGGKWTNVIHFDDHADVTQHLMEKKELGAKSTVLWLGSYFQNLQKLEFFIPKKGDDGVYVLALPASPTLLFPMLDVEDTGLVVKAILRQGEALMGKTVMVSGEDELTAGRMVEEFGKYAGVPTKFYELPAQVFHDAMKAKGVPEFMAMDVFEVLKAFEEFGPELYSPPGVVNAATILGPGEKLKNWDEYAQALDWSWAKQ